MVIKVPQIHKLMQFIQRAPWVTFKSLQFLPLWIRI
ncbi:unnamed protein product, partial [Vitis vinifera]|uniref:Uncharacterized protein n=1 Tax=Vitis vinifera TaxID=29760 RepID=D7TR16_VITVI